VPPKSQDKKMSWFWEIDFEVFKRNPFKYSLHVDMQKMCVNFEGGRGIHLFYPKKHTKYKGAINSNKWKLHVDWKYGMSQP
jgi:hypothetical protein